MQIEETKWAKKIEERLNVLERMIEESDDPEDKMIDESIRKVVKMFITFSWLIKISTNFLTAIGAVILAWNIFSGYIKGQDTNGSN